MKRWGWLAIFGAAVFGILPGLAGTAGAGEKHHGSFWYVVDNIMEIAEDICDRIGIINRGKMVAMGTFEELRHIAKDIDSSMDLEDIFLKLTEQDESIKDIVKKLRTTMKNGRGSK